MRGTCMTLHVLGAAKAAEGICCSCTQPVYKRQGLTCHESCSLRDSKSLLFLQVAKASTASKWFVRVPSCVVLHLQTQPTVEVVFLLQHWADIPGIAKGCEVQPNSVILFIICVVMLAYVFFGVQSTVIANNPSISFLKISTTPASPIPQESGHIALMFFLWVVWDICSSDCQQELCQISNRGANGTGKQNQTKTYYEHVRTVLPYVCLLRRHDKPRKSKDLCLYWKGGDMKYEYGSAAVVKWFDMSKAG